MGAVDRCGKREMVEKRGILVTNLNKNEKCCICSSIRRDFRKDF